MRRISDKIFVLYLTSSLIPIRVPNLCYFDFKPIFILTPGSIYALKLFDYSQFLIVKSSSRFRCQVYKWSIQFLMNICNPMQFTTRHWLLQHRQLRNFHFLIRCLLKFVSWTIKTNMSLESICVILKWMQYLLMVAYKKGLCVDICPIQCAGYGYSAHGGHGDGHGNGYDFRDTPNSYGHIAKPNGFNVEDLARAMGVPSNTFSELTNDTITPPNANRRYPQRGNRMASRNAPKGNRTKVKQAITQLDFKGPVRT